jgi:hypothetical protein
MNPSVFDRANPKKQGKKYHSPFFYYREECTRECHPMYIGGDVVAISTVLQVKILAVLNNFSTYLKSLNWRAFSPKREEFKEIAVAPRHFGHQVLKPRQQKSLKWGSDLQSLRSLWTFF